MAAEESSAMGDVSSTPKPSICEVAVVVGAEEYQDQGEYHAEPPLGAGALSPATTPLSLTGCVSTSIALSEESGATSPGLVVSWGGSTSIACSEGWGVSLATVGIFSSGVELCGGSITGGDKEEEASFVIAGVDDQPRYPHQDDVCCGGSAAFDVVGCDSERASAGVVTGCEEASAVAGGTSSPDELDSPTKEFVSVVELGS